MPLSFQYYGYAISVVACTKVIHLIALSNLFGFCTFPLGFLHTCDWDPPPFQHVGNFSALSCHCSEIDCQQPHSSSSLDLLLYPQSPILGSPCRLVTLTLGRGCGASITEHALALSLFSEVVLFLMDLNFPVGFLQPVVTRRQPSSFLSRAWDRPWRSYVHHT